MITLERARELESRYSAIFSVRRGDLILFSYRFADYLMYRQEPDSVELRGIVFDRGGNVVLRPYPKFFNLGEPLCPVSEGEYGVANEKLDGSMVSAALRGGRLVAATRKSLGPNPHLERALGILRSREGYLRLLEENPGKTAIFELLDPEFLNIVPYTRSELVLVGLRDNATGAVAGPEELEELGRAHGIPVAPVRYRGKVGEIKRAVRPLEGVEGVVVHADSGLAKIKTAWYVRLHRHFSLRSDRYLKYLYLSGELDDLYPELPGPLRERVDELVAGVREEIGALAETIREWASRFPRTRDGRRALARAMASAGVDRGVRWAVFRAFDGGDPEALAVEVLKRRYWRGGGRSSL